MVVNKLVSERRSRLTAPRAGFVRGSLYMGNKKSNRNGYFLVFDLGVLWSRMY